MHDELRAFAPGRVELAGNHTDHEGGLVLTAATDMGVDVRGRVNGDGVLRVRSAGYPACELAIDGLADAAPDPGEFGTSAALVRGVAACLARGADAPMGLDLQVSSSLPAGGGLSSSAAFELALAVALDLAWHDGGHDPLQLARIARSVERDWFGKPCGLMDQLAVAYGGVTAFDLSDEENPGVERVECDLDAAGFAVVLVDVGAGHADLTHEYALIPAEMQAVARLLGGERLADVSEEAVMARTDDVRRQLGDRALLRAMHFYQEQRLTRGRIDALRTGDEAAFHRLTRLSGASSAQWLQNVTPCAPTDGSSQPAMVALAFAERLLEGEGSARIHGGGFGGSIQVFVPKGRLAGFVIGMETLLFSGCCRLMRLGGTRAWARWE